MVGGGATGIQFLFEIADFLRRQHTGCKLRLIHSEERVLQQFPPGFSTYVEGRMADLEIAFYPNTYYREQQADEVLLEERDTLRQFSLSSAMSLLFLGKTLQMPLSANVFGQVVIQQTALQNIFTAGDCSIYNSFGSNSMTAQSAVRKGMLAARNILRHSGTFKLPNSFRCMESYICGVPSVKPPPGETDFGVGAGIWAHSLFLRALPICFLADQHHQMPD